MEIRSLKFSTISAVPASFIRRDLIGKRFVNGRIFKLSMSGRETLAASKLRIFRVTSQASDGFRSISPVEAVSNSVEKDDDVVFVAGATGRVGSRTVRELLKLGFRVRAGVRSAQKAEALVESVKKIQDANSTIQPVERLELVECDLEKPETIIPALGKAAVVICCIGASEKEVFDVTGPYRIDYLATKNLVDAAAVAKVRHFIMVSSLGTNKFGFPAAILNLFWGVLFWKRKAEEALIASGIPCTIVRPGGMERPTDAYKETHNIRLSEEDTLFGGQVSNLQVAELMAFMAKNRRLSYCKIVEVIAETSAPLRPLDELLAKIPYQRVPPKELDSPVRSSPELPKERAPEPESDLQEEPLEVTTLPKPESETIEVKPVEASASITRPLSPFTAYEDLKPPTSPSPSPPSNTSAPVKADRDSRPSDTAKPEDPNMPVEEASTLIDTLLPEAVLATSPNLPDSNITDGATTGSLPTDSQTPILRPLSPFTAYEDLKPPSSPSPITSGSRGIPPTSSPPVQTLSANLENASTPEQESSQTNYRGTTDQDTKKQEAPRVAAHYHSPYYAYEDFKPPTSPSPAPPLTNSSISPSSSPNGGLATNVINTPDKELSTEAPEQAQITENVQYTKPKSSPLSPFTMYEDLKPPTSPVPSPWVGKI